MEGVFRSEKMTLCQFYLPAESAFQTVSELGELGLVQFRDLNPDLSSYSRKFVSEVRRCEDMERQLRFFEKEIRKSKDLKLNEVEDVPKAPIPGEIATLENTFEQHEQELKELMNTNDSLKQNFLELTELSSVLKQTDDFFVEAEENVVTDSKDMEGIDVSKIEAQVQAGERRMQLGFVAGVMPRAKVGPFMRMLWFACKGNVFVKHVDLDDDIEDPSTGEPVRKSVFSVFFQGDRLEAKVKKICEGFRATIYPCPESPAERRQMREGVQARIEDLQTVLKNAVDQHDALLAKLAKKVPEWSIMVYKVKAIFYTLNLFAIEKTNFVAEFYCAQSEISLVREALERATEVSGTSAPSLLHELPCKKLPTKFRTNKFTHGFQVLINSYGFATYQEVNPTLFTIITFPFLFSVMFGDAGHGMIMFLFGLWMVVKEKSLANANKSSEIWRIFYGGRYIIFLMGLFSIHSGLLYNDCFAKSLNIFGTSWKVIYDNKTIAAEPHRMLNPANPRVYNGHPYAFGVDPIWQLAKNKITFLNSYKKKISVIFGIAQMTAGLVMSLINGIYFKKKLNIFCEFIPQIIFLWCIFGYLSILMFIKWGIYDAAESHCAPSLLIGLINMFMFRYDSSSTTACATRPWYSGQPGFQTFLVVVAVLCVPWMLLVKPLLLRRWHLQAAVHQKLVEDYGQREIPLTGFDPQALFSEEVGQSSTDPKVEKEIPLEDEQEINKVLKHSASLEEDKEEFDFGDIFIHQAIHTIEFCLGCISHTASYLRLWALSLAHAQLSEVLWNMVLSNGIGAPTIFGAFMTVAVFPSWAMMTLAILLLMEGLSAFLHTLRLHWVEYQSKFFEGEGFPFEPLNFHKMLEEQQNE